jgi:hypothetical protein
MKDNDKQDWWRWRQRGSTPPKDMFNIPEELLKNKSKGKIILVMDLDETMVFTRRSYRPPHQNYELLPVPFPACR